LNFTKKEKQFLKRKMSDSVEAINEEELMNQVDYDENLENGDHPDQEDEEHLLLEEQDFGPPVRRKLEGDGEEGEQTTAEEGHNGDGEAHSDSATKTQREMEEGEEEPQQGSNNNNKGGSKSSKPAPSAPIPPNNVLFVSRYHILATGIKAQHFFREVFEPFGPIKSIKVLAHSSFIEFVSLEDAIKAKEALHHSKNLNGDSIIVDYRKSIPPPPRHNVSLSLSLSLALSLSLSLSLTHSLTLSLL
jgi:hypothetical protein